MRVTSHFFHCFIFSVSFCQLIHELYDIYTCFIVLFSVSNLHSLLTKVTIYISFIIFFSVFHFHQLPEFRDAWPLVVAPRVPLVMQSNAWLYCRAWSWCTTWAPAWWWTASTWCWGTCSGSSRGLTPARPPTTKGESPATRYCSPSGVSVWGRWWWRVRGMMKDGDEDGSRVGK